MRAREKERFIRMNFTEKELEIRDRLYKERKHARFKIVITQEHYDDKKRKHQGNDPTYKSGYLSYFSDYPEDGDYVDTIYFYNPDQLDGAIMLYEGLFYQLFDLETGERFGYGCFDPDSPYDEIRDRIGMTCEHVCQFCFWRGSELKHLVGTGWVYQCDNPEEK